jgi:hypothetical protein
MPRIPRSPSTPAPRAPIANGKDAQVGNATPNSPAQPGDALVAVNDSLDTQASTANVADLRPSHTGTATPGRTAALGGHGLVAPGDATAVQNKSLARTLRVSFRACEKHFDVVGDARQPDNAYPRIRAGRREIWDTIDRIDRSHLSRESPELQAAIGNLKEFADEWRHSTDERNMPRKWQGSSRQAYDGTWTKTPGLKDLLQAVFSAAGMGQVEPSPRDWR